MKLVNIYSDSKELICIVIHNKLFPMDKINKLFYLDYPLNLFDLIAQGFITPLEKLYENNIKNNVDNLNDYLIPDNNIKYAPLYNFPSKIIGIGLNFKEHSNDLHAKTPQEYPVIFIKPYTTIIGHEGTIKIPKQSCKTTVEAELGIIISKKAKNILEKDVWDYIAGFTTVIDITAEDILNLNPRYLTLSKSFDTFFSFGPSLLTKREVSTISNLRISTVINGQIIGSNTVSNMIFNPFKVVSFLSQCMTLLPGDIISTGTPKAVIVKDGDITECRIDGFKPLINVVVDLKK